jgi:hypothetical protein
MSHRSGPETQFQGASDESSCNDDSFEALVRVIRDDRVFLFGADGDSCEDDSETDFSSSDDEFAALDRAMRDDFCFLRKAHAYDEVIAARRAIYALDRSRPEPQYPSPDFSDAVLLDARQLRIILFAAGVGSSRRCSSLAQVLVANEVDTLAALAHVDPGEFDAMGVTAPEQTRLRVCAAEVRRRYVGPLLRPMVGIDQAIGTNRWLEAKWTVTSEPTGPKLGQINMLRSV